MYLGVNGLTGRSVNIPPSPISLPHLMPKVTVTHAQVWALNSLYARDGREAMPGQWGFGRRIIRGRAPAGAGGRGSAASEGAPAGIRKAKGASTIRCRKCHQVLRQHVALD